MTDIPVIIIRNIILEQQQADKKNAKTKKSKHHPIMAHLQQNPIKDFGKKQGIKEPQTTFNKR